MGRPEGHPHCSEFPSHDNTEGFQLIGNRLTNSHRFEQGHHSAQHNVSELLGEPLPSWSWKQPGCFHSSGLKAHMVIFKDRKEWSFASRACYFGKGRSYHTHTPHPSSRLSNPPLCVTILLCRQEASLGLLHCSIKLRLGICLSLGEGRVSLCVFIVCGLYE